MPWSTGRIDRYPVPPRRPWLYSVPRLRNTAGVRSVGEDPSRKSGPGSVRFSAGTPWPCSSGGRRRRHPGAHGGRCSWPASLPEAGLGPPWRGGGAGSWCRGWGGARFCCALLAVCSRLFSAAVCALFFCLLSFCLSCHENFLQAGRNSPAADVSRRPGAHTLTRRAPGWGTGGADCEEERRPTRRPMDVLGSLRKMRLHAAPWLLVAAAVVAIGALVYLTGSHDSSGGGSRPGSAQSGSASVARLGVEDDPPERGAPR